jgi:hypothetical protein
LRTPLKTVPADVLRRAAPECRYLVTDADGRAVLAGAATPGTEGSFQIDLSDRLQPGDYTLWVLLAVNGNMTGSDIRRIALAVR